MDLLPNLKVISTPSTGVNHIDVEAATARGIRVGHTPGHFLCDSVAEFAIGLLLASARSILISDNVKGTADISRLVSIASAWGKGRRRGRGGGGGWRRRVGLLKGGLGCAYNSTLALLVNKLEVETA